MKKIYYNILLVLVCGLFASCMNGNDGLFGDDWKVPATPDANLYGNPSIKETNLLTIAQLKAKYATEISTEGKYAQVTEPMQIKAIVTANDIQGNMYNEIAVQDETGAIFIGIAQGGVFGYLAVGQEISVTIVRVQLLVRLIPKMATQVSVVCLVPFGRTISPIQASQRQLPLRYFLHHGTSTLMPANCVPSRMSASKRVATTTLLPSSMLIHIPS